MSLFSKLFGTSRPSQERPAPSTTAAAKDEIKIIAIELGREREYQVFNPDLYETALSFASELMVGLYPRFDSVKGVRTNFDGPKDTIFVIKASAADYGRGTREFTRSFPGSWQPSAELRKSQIVSL